MKYTAVDLFSGGGGLTEGLKQAGFFVCGAVEIDENAAKVYSDNNPQAEVFRTDIRSLRGCDLIETSPTGKIDLIAACPPCQGFSKLTNKYKREDGRNQLIFEFVRLVYEISPPVIMMENVPGLANGRGAALFSEALHSFCKMGYRLKYQVVDVADYGVPQHRKRLVLLGAKYGDIPIPEPTFGKNRKPWRTVEDVLINLPVPDVYNSKKLKSGVVKEGWHVTRNISPINLARLKCIPPCGNRTFIPESLRPKCHKNKNRGFINVYGRMEWKKPAPTITGGFTTLSKGKFGHPTEQRTISVYEGALLQTFPTDYVFNLNSMDSVCQIIGNALPPLFAKEMAKACMDFLKALK